MTHRKRTEGRLGAEVALTYTSQGSESASPESWTGGTHLGPGTAAGELASAASRASGHPPETGAIFFSE